MCTEDELVPLRPVGRPFRSVERGFEYTTGTVVDLCRDCPRCNAGRRWCPLRASLVNPRSKPCRYGLVLIRAAKQAARRNNGK